MTNEQAFTAIFGPKSAHSEYTIGQVVRSVSDGRLQTGEITWTSRASDDHPLHYWINGLTCLSQNDLLGLVEEDEPVCPGCGHPVCAHPIAIGTCKGWRAMAGIPKASRTGQHSPFAHLATERTIDLVSNGASRSTKGDSHDRRSGTRGSAALGARALARG